MDEMISSVLGMNGYTYPLATGENYYCVPACIKIILHSVGIQVGIHELASNFSIITPDRAIDENDLGVHVKDGDLQAIFHKYNAPLYEEYVPITHISEYEFTDYLQDLLYRHTHIICGYSFGYLFSDQSKIDIGHASIVISCDSEYVSIINPGPLYGGINKVHESALYGAIRRKKDGLWIVKSRG